MSPYLLALVAAATHAWWNFLLKRAGATARIIGLTKIAEAVLFAPLFAIALWQTPEGGLRGLLPLAVIGAILSAANYWFLGRAYARGDFSLVYPVSRGGILLVVPLLGWLAFGETITAATAAAIALILLGIASLQLDSLSRTALRRLVGSLATSPGTTPAFLAATAAAGYTVWDKHAVQAIAPFTYFYAYTLMVAIGFALPLRSDAARSAARLDWHHHRATIVAVGALNTITYLLILLALKDGHSTRVIALRQLSIALGAWLGWVLLREAATPPRRLGVALIVAGALLVAVG